MQPVPQEDDSSAESDDDIVLDQSLATNNNANLEDVHAGKPVVLQQSHRVVMAQPAIAPPSQPILGDTASMQQPVLRARDSVHDSMPVANKALITPTIITIAPPTLKSNKGSAMNASEPSLAASATATATSTTATAASTSTATATATATAAASTATRTSGPAPPIPFHGALQSQAQSASEKRGSDKDDVIRPRIDSKLLKLMMNEQSAAGHGHDNHLMDLDLDCLTAKPWTAPNADITDWFNYGFNEETWRQYCTVQNVHRQHLKRTAHQFSSNATSIPSSSYSTRSTNHNLSANTPQILITPHQHQHQHQHQQQQQHQHQIQHPNSNVRVNVNVNPNANPTPTPTPIQTHHGICFDFQNKGHCLRGASCRWSHNVGHAASVWQHSHANPSKPDAASRALHALRTLHTMAPSREQQTGNAEIQKQSMLARVEREAVKAEEHNKHGEDVNMERERETERDKEKEDTQTETATDNKQSTELQARLQQLLGAQLQAPNISVVSNLLGENEEQNESVTKKKKKRKKKKEKHKRSRSRSRSRTESRSDSRSRSRSRRSETGSKD